MYLLLLVECSVDVCEVYSLECCFRFSVSLLMVCLTLPFTTESEIRRSLPITVDLSIFFFDSVGFCVIHFGALVLGACMVSVVTSSRRIDPFTLTVCSSLCLDPALWESWNDAGIRDFAPMHQGCSWSPAPVTTALLFGQPCTGPCAAACRTCPRSHTPREE